MKIILKHGKFFEHGVHYFVEFNYENKEEQTRMYDVFNTQLIPTQGSNSYRAQQGKEYIMPYLVDEKGNMTPENTGRVGGTSIPADLLSEFVRRFMEVDGATVIIGDEVMRGSFNLAEFERVLPSIELQAELKMGPYFGHGDLYYVEFTYGSREQQDRMYDVFNTQLIPTQGSNSYRAQQGKEYIMPYLVDEKGNMSPENTGIVGGTSIPADLLSEFVRRFVEVDGAVVRVGNEIFKDTFDQERFDVAFDEFKKRKKK